MNKAKSFLLAVAVSTLIGCATPKQAVRPAISQTAVTVQRHDSKTNEGGTVSIYIDDKVVIENLEDMQTVTTVVNNGVHVINAKCPNGESAMLNFTASSKTVAFLTAYKGGGFFSRSDCRLERMIVDDDTGYMTTEKQQQHYNDQTKYQHGYPPPQQGYPPQYQHGYPPPQQGYPPQYQHGYPPPQQEYPQQYQQGYPPPQQNANQEDESELNSNTAIIVAVSIITFIIIIFW